jgi:hypothetical protein
VAAPTLDDDLSFSLSTRRRSLHTAAFGADRGDWNALATN